MRTVFARQTPFSGGQADTVKITPGKLAGMKAVSNDRGVIAAAAMDQRGSLKKALAKEKGGGRRRPRDGRVQDPRHRGADPARQRDPARSRVGPPGEQAAREGRRAAAGLREDRLRREHARAAARPARRLVRAPPEGSGRRLPQDPALLHAVRSEGRSTTTSTRGSSASATSAAPTTSRSSSSSSATKKASTRRGSSSRRRSRRSSPAHGGVHQGPLRRRRAEGRSADQHEVRRGRHACSAGQKAYTKQEAMDHFRRAADVATKPFIYLSAGVSNAEFTETLELAAKPARGSRACCAAAPRGRTASRSTASRAARRSASGSKPKA